MELWEREGLFPHHLSQRITFCRIHVRAQCTHISQSKVIIQESMFAFVNQSTQTPVIALRLCRLLASTGKPEAMGNA